MAIQIPSYQPVVLSIKSDLPKGMVPVETNSSCLPTHIVSNQLGTKGFIEEGPQAWTACHPNWISSHQVLPDELVFPIDNYGKIDPNGKGITKTGANPICFLGWRYVTHKETIYPSRVVLKKSDITLCSGAPRQFSTYLTNLSINPEDPRYELCQIRGNYVDFRVVGQLSTEEWKKLNHVLNYQVKSPAFYNQTIPKANGIPIPEHALDEITPTVWNGGFAIKPEQLLKLEPRKRDIILNPFILTGNVEKIYTKVSHFSSPVFVSMTLKDALSSGLRCTALYWADQNTIYVDPNLITHWPAVATPCQFRGLPGFIGQTPYFDETLWQRASLSTGKTTKKATHIFVFPYKNNFRSIGLQSKNEQSALTSKLSELHLLLGANCEAVYEKTLGKIPSTVEGLNTYISDALKIQSGEYVDNQTFYKLPWIYEKIKNHERLTAHTTIREKWKNTPLESLPQDVQLALIHFGNLPDEKREALKLQLSGPVAQLDAILSAGNTEE